MFPGSYSKVVALSIKTMYKALWHVAYVWRPSKPCCHSGATSRVVVWLPRERVLRVDVGGGRGCFAEVGDEKAITDCAQGWPWDTMRDNKTCKTRDLEGRRTERDDAEELLLSPGAGGRWSSWLGGSVKGRGEESWLRSERGMLNGVLCYRDCLSKCKLLFRSQTKDLLT